MADANRTSRRRTRTREQLVEAARAIISEKGVSGLKMGELAERADVGLGSFYNHFSSKEELVGAVVGESLEALAASVATGDAADQDPAELVSNAIRRFVAVAAEDPGFAQLMVHLNHADTVFAAAVRPYAGTALRRAIDAGRLHTPDAEVAVTTIMGGSLALMRAIADGETPAEGAPEAYAEMVLRALGLPAREAQRIAHRELPAHARDAA